ncbi:MAG: flagellar FlbD family protein [Leptospiraceae bacterium]|nr:flagellar FlbD family protein [Leptospiraceae bacterium]
MVTLHRLNNTEITINAFQIESLESTPDTVVTLVNEKKFIVRESVDEVKQSVVEFHKTIFQPIIESPKKEGQKK